MARTRTIEACTRAGRDNRVAFSGPSIAGLLSPLRAGLAAAAIAKGSAPDDLEILPPSDDLPEIGGIDIAPMRSDASQTPDFILSLAQEIEVSPGAVNKNSDTSGFR